MSRLPQVAHAHRRAYPSDLSDAEWQVIEPLLPRFKGFGHPRQVDLRAFSILMRCSSRNE